MKVSPRDDLVSHNHLHMKQHQVNLNISLKQVYKDIVPSRQNAVHFPKKKSNSYSFKQLVAS